MRILSAIALYCVICLLSGCVVHRSVPGHLNYFVDGRTSHMSLLEVNCDAASPPNCEKRIVHYDRGAELLLRPQVTK